MSSDNPYTPPKADAEIISQGPYKIDDIVLTKTSLRHNRICIITGKTLPESTKPQTIKIHKNLRILKGKGVLFSAYINPAILKKQNLINTTAYIIIAFSVIVFWQLIPMLTLYLIYSFLSPLFLPLFKITIVKTENNFYHIKGTHPEFLKSLPSFNHPS